MDSVLAIPARLKCRDPTILQQLSAKSSLYNSEAICFCSTVVDEVWQEQTLHRLLNLVELPLLENVLQCIQNPTSPPPTNLVAHGNPDLIYSSNHLDRQILKAFKNSQYDCL